MPLLMSYEFQNREKIPVAILGATGSVGQRFVEMLSHHPWFEIVFLGASERSVGKSYAAAVNWLMATPLSADIGKLVVQPCSAKSSAVIAFSALDSNVAGTIEKLVAESGCVVISNSSHHRMQADVPLIIPEVNSSHLELLKGQCYGRGKIITNPNCTAIGLTIALKPLYDNFGIDAVHVVTMQAISGAGYPGVASMDILDNVIPYISGEEQKVEQEPLKILGKCHGGTIENAAIVISAQCNRVPVSDGHTACVSIKLKAKPKPEEVIEAWQSFSGEVQPLALHLAPKQPIHYFAEPNFPQPKLHRLLDRGMSISIGRLRACSLYDYKFTLLSHNTIRGAAGGAILCAELMVRKGLIYW